MWNEWDSWPKLLCQSCAVRDIFRDNQDEWPTLLAKVYLHQLYGAWEEIERGARVFFFLSVSRSQERAHRDGDAAWRCQDHVANQRRSLCGTKKITVTRLTTHGDTNRVNVAYTRCAYAHTNILVLAVDRRYLRLHTSSPLALGSYSANSKVLRLRLRHSSPPYVRALAYRNAFKMTLPRDVYRTRIPWERISWKPFRVRPFSDRRRRRRQKMQTHAISFFAFEWESIG